MKGTAPGKVILLGEHAVVYGHPALAAALPLHLTVELRHDPQGPSLDLPGHEVPAGLRAAMGEMARAAGVSPQFCARVSSEIPLGSGLGSSAALGVALARALKPCPPDEAARLALILEKVLHGAPSGVDPAISARGGIIQFVRGDPPRIEKVALRSPLFLCVALTGIARGTHSTVLPLSERRVQEPQRYDALLDSLGKLVPPGRAALERGDLALLGSLFDTAQALLVELGVSCAELEQSVGALRGAGALGAKLTGAGGGGAAIGLARDEAHARELAARVGKGAFAARIAEDREQGEPS